MDTGCTRMLRLVFKIQKFYLDVLSRSSILEVISRKRLKVLGNFSTMNMIVATLNNYSILRLHRTWPIVDTSSKDLLEEMNQLSFRPIYDSSRSESQAVLIPFLGYYFTRKVIWL